MSKPPPRTRSRNTGWTPARQRQFIADLPNSGNVQALCAAAGLSRASVYKLRDRSPAFAAAWDAGLAVHDDQMAQEAMARITTGETRGVKYKGRIIGERVVYSTRLLCSMLVRGHSLDLYAEREAEKHMTKASTVST